MRRRTFTKPHEELVAIAVERGAQTLRSVFAVLEKSGHASHIALDGAAGAAGLLAVAHASFKEALIEIEGEHELFEGVELSGHAMAPLHDYVPDPEALAKARVRLTHLRSIPVGPLDFDEMIVAAATARGLKQHPDGTACTCPPECNCHPPTRNEDAIVTGERGSWHLDTCPASPKNRGKVVP